METTTTNKTNFIWEAVEQDLESGRYQNVHLSLIHISEPTRRS